MQDKIPEMLEKLTAMQDRMPQRCLKAHRHAGQVFHRCLKSSQPCHSHQDKYSRVAVCALCSGQLTQCVYCPGDSSHSSMCTVQWVAHTADVHCTVGSSVCAVQWAAHTADVHCTVGSSHSSLCTTKWAAHSAACALYSG